MKPSHVIPFVWNFEIRFGLVCLLGHTINEARADGLIDT